MPSALGFKPVLLAAAESKAIALVVSLTEISCCGWMPVAAEVVGAAARSLEVVVTAEEPVGAQLSWVRCLA